MGTQVNRERQKIKHLSEGKHKITHIILYYTYQNGKNTLTDKPW